MADHRREHPTIDVHVKIKALHSEVQNRKSLKADKEDWENNAVLNIPYLAYTPPTRLSFSRPFPNQAPPKLNNQT